MSRQERILSSDLPLTIATALELFQPVNHIFKTCITDSPFGDHVTMAIQFKWLYSGFMAPCVIFLDCYKTGVKENCTEVQLIPALAFMPVVTKDLGADCTVKFEHQEYLGKIYKRYGDAILEGVSVPFAPGNTQTRQVLLYLSQALSYMSAMELRLLNDPPSDPDAKDELSVAIRITGPVAPP